MGVGELVKVAVSISWDHPPCRSWDISHVGFWPGPQCPQHEALPTHDGVSKSSSAAWFLKGKALVHLPAKWFSFISLMKYYFLNIFLSLCRTKSSSQGPSWCFQMHFYLITCLGMLSCCFLTLDHLIFDLSLFDSLCYHTMLRQIKELRAFGGIPGGATVRWVWVGMSDSVPFLLLVF